MIGVHLIIGLCEGALTFAVLAYLRRVRPELLGLDPAGAGEAPRRPGYGVVTASLLVTALLLAGVVSWFASTCPDGLEWSYREHRYEGAEQVIAQDSAAIAAVDQWQSQWSPLPDYARRETALGQQPAAETAPAAETTPAAAAWPNLDGWGSLAGVVGTIVTLVLLYGAARILRKTVPA